MLRKAIIVVAATMIIVASCFAQPSDVDAVHDGTVIQVVVWDNVIEGVDGQPLIEGDVVAYEVFYRHSLTGIQGSLGVVTLAESSVDLSGLLRGYYYIGVRSIITDAEGVVEQSEIVWSNNAVVVAGDRFAMLVPGRIVPERPSGLRVGQ